jgi:hypothetical protein
LFLITIFIQGAIGCRVVFPSEVSLVLRKMRAMMVIITQYVIPLALTGYLYGMVVYTIWQRERIGTVSDTKKQSFDKTKRRTVKMLIIVTALFALAWFPTHLMHFLKFYTNVIPISEGKSQCNATTFYMICYWLGISTCSYNAFIYCHFNDDFKNEFKRYFNCLIPCFKFDTKDKEKKQDDSCATNPTSSSADYSSTTV